MVKGSGGRRTILVVDDEPEVCRSTALLLESLGFAVVEASDGDTALSALDQNPSIALIFTDLILPGGTKGSDLARQALVKRPGLKVLLTSGRPELLDDEAFAVIVKPFRLNELAQKIEAALGTPGHADP